MQKITIIGFLTKDPEVRKVRATGEPFTSMNVRVKQEEGVAYYSCSVYNKLGENCAKYLKAGRQVAIIGTLKINQTNGRVYHNVTVTDCEFLHGKDDDNQTEQTTQTGPSMEGTPLDGYEDVQGDYPWR